MIQKLYLLFGEYLNNTVIQKHAQRGNSQSETELKLLDALKKQTKRELQLTDITDYVFSANTKFVSESIKTLRDESMILFVMYDKQTFNPTTGAQEVSLAISVATPYAESTSDQLYDTDKSINTQYVLLELLKDLIITRSYDGEECRDCLHFSKDSLELKPLDPIDFFGLTGWTAYVTVYN